MTPVYSGNSSLPPTSGWRLNPIAGIATHSFVAVLEARIRVAGGGNKKESRGSNPVLQPRAAPKVGSSPFCITLRENVSTLGRDSNSSRNEPPWGKHPIVRYQTPTSDVGVDDRHPALQKGCCIANAIRSYENLSCLAYSVMYFCRTSGARRSCQNRRVSFGKATCRLWIRDYSRPIFKSSGRTSRLI